MAAVPSYVFRRPESGIWFFRWSVPASYRELFEGKQEIRHTLKTDNRGLALRLARQLASMLDRDILRRMAASESGKDKPTWGLFVKLVEHLIDGSVRLHGVQMDPDPARGEEERKHLAALMGKHPKGAAASAEGVKLSELVEGFLKEGDRAKRWSAKTRQEVDASLKLFVEILGADTPVGTLDRKQLAHFKDCLQRLPSNRSKNPLYRGKSASDLASMAIPAADLMDVSTINKVLGRAGGLLKWAAVNGHVAINYAEGMGIKTGKRAHDDREPWTDEEVRKLIDAVLSGAHGSGEAPYRKWVPLIGAFGGLRINEACQLTTSDFAEADGVPVFYVTDEGEGQRVKTVNSKRMVPIHQELVRMGLLEYVKARASGAKGSVRLFPELPVGRDGPGQTASKWFGKFRKQLGVDKPFHSLRHGVATRLREAGVPEDVVAELLGHARGTTESFQRYAKAASVKRLHDALCKLSYNAERS